VGGAGGWGTFARAKDYHNDAGVKSSLIVKDLAREVGETLGVVNLSTIVGPDYVRRAIVASCVLEDVIKGSQWWVDYDGKTNIGSRSTYPDTGPYELISYSPRDRVAELGLDDLSSIRVGTVLSQRLDTTQIIRELTVVLDANKLRAFAWCGGVSSDSNRVMRALGAIIARSDVQLFGKYRYRVVRMAGARVELQAVRKSPGLPDILPISQVSGVAGAWARLSAGSEVFVEFECGAPALPMVTAFAPRSWAGSGAGFVPERLILGAESEGEAKDVARKGDGVKVLLAPAVFTGTIAGSPASGVLTFPSMYTLGTIESGSSKVGVG
jgi:hypothetical protein